MRPHHLERAIRYVLWGKPSDKEMYDHLQSALDANPDATVTFVADFDVVCKGCSGSQAGCSILIEELTKLDQEVASRLGLKLNTPYRIRDVISALENEKSEKPREWFAMSHGDEQLQEWRDEVKELALKAISE